tara:strand:+ start:6934 stop:7611 length:678 start_codon:yes stop_codon:yes gene_type:complete
MNQIKHVAIIMDGNGRWGIKNKKSRNLGHKEGLKTVEMIIEQSLKKKIKFLTLYAFSTENWKRPRIEINFLLNLLETFLKEKIESLIKNNIKLKILGNIKKFPPKTQKLLISSENQTIKSKKLQINLALNYGSKDEIIQAMKSMKNKNSIINEKSLNAFLYTTGIPDPDILIRTGNTYRLSNFLLWQLAYSELFFIKKMWPDFKKKDYINILNKFQKTKRNFGNI